MVLLENDTDLPLIAGDQPLINTLGRGDGTPPTDLEFYYPLTPTLAMVLTERADVYPDARKPMSRAEVEDFNHGIAAASHEFLFANSENVLRTMIDVHR